MARLLLLIVIGLMPMKAWGQQSPWTLRGGFGLTLASFERSIGGSDGSIGLQFDFSPRLYRVLVLRFDFGVEYLGGVCFEVEDACEVERTRAASEETFMLSGSVAAGIMTPPVWIGTSSEGMDLAVGLLVGREWVEAGFAWGDCIYCRVRGLDVDGGYFLEPTLEASISGLGVSVSYRTYNSASDLERRISVRLIATGN